MDEFIDKFLEPLRVFFDKLLAAIPYILVMLIILIIGLIIAAGLRHFTYKVLTALRFEEWSKQTGFSSFIEKSGVRSDPARFISLFVYWITLLTFIMAGLGSLQITAAKTLASGFFLYLPKFFSALLLIILGYYVSGFLSRAALIAAVNAGVEYSKFLSNLVRLFILVFTFAMALEQLQIAPKTVTVAFSIFFGGIFLALAIAFGTGGRDMARRILEERMKKKERNDTEPL